MHGSGGTANPPTLFLDAVAPTATTAKSQDSPSIKFGGGNAWTAVGSWTASPAVVSGSLTALGAVDLWLGLKNSDDIGTRFDLRVQAYRNGTLVASGESRCIQGITRNPNLAKEVAVPFDPFAPAAFDGTTDVFSLTVLTRVGTTASGAFCGGHSNAGGLRSYFDATSRAADLELTIAPTEAGFASVSAGKEHTCGVTTDGAAYCWGSNDHGQLGDDTRIDRRAPVAVQGGLTFASVSAGLYHSCGVTTAGAAYCWGDNQVGELGSGTTESNVPVAVSGGLTFGSVSAGFHHSCGVTTAEAAYCWGYGAFYQLGTGANASSSAPVLVAGGLTFASVSTDRYRSCGLTTTGAAYCWGNNSDGQIGDGTTNSGHVPVAVLGGLTFASLSAGDAHTCGSTTVDSPAAGAAYCWGANGFGQLGDGTNTGSTEPVLVLGGLAYAVASAGDVHTCGVTPAGAAHCWGSGGSGQLGNNTFTFFSNVPVAVSGGYSFPSVSAGGNHVCGVSTASVAYCWGRNSHGELGDGTFSGSRSSPVQVSWP